MLKALSRREMIRKLRVLGFEGPSSGGKHQFMKRGAFKLRIPNPHSSDVSVNLLRRLLRQAGIDETDWEQA
ncbi:type II toxin-antitoxin system HicA family toxin [Candidatus Acetothermia bacterium]|nr:type II toxin-antitoxin system HicA family toxin [Candidatus Acetothermia bacterium]